MRELGILGFGRGGGCACKANWKTIESLAAHPLFASSTAFQLGLSDAASSISLKDQELVCSVDMIGPVSRNARHFGAISACHGLSDLFAVGAKPSFALAIAAWPPDAEILLPEAFQGIHEVLAQAEVQILGGHTAHSEQPLLGICAFGFRPRIAEVRVRTGDRIYLTKAIGTGVAIGALQEHVCPAALEKSALTNMLALNSIGLELNQHPAVRLVSDVTGFGLMGQAIRLARSAEMSVIIEGRRVPAFPKVRDFIRRGWGSSAAEINLLQMKEFVQGTSRISMTLAADPQTNGPLLVVADSSIEGDFKSLRRIGILNNDADQLVIIS